MECSQGKIMKRYRIGRIRFASGDEYIGEFREGNRSGIGLMVYHTLQGVAGDHDEAVYLGEWKAN